MIRFTVLLGLVVLMAGASARGQDVLSLRLRPAGGAPPKITLTGKTADDHQRDIAAWLKQQYPAFDITDPACRSVVWFMSRWLSGGLTQKADISDKYYDIAAENFNACQELTALIGKTALPPEFKSAWRARHAQDLIELRLQLDLAGEAARLAEIPTDGAKLVKCADGGEFHRHLGQAYPQLASTPPADVKRFHDVLARINPGFSYGGMYVADSATVETLPHVRVPLNERQARIFWYRLDPAMPVLLPSHKWVAERAAALADTTVEPDARPQPATVHRLVIDKLLRQDVPLHLHALCRDGQVRNVWATTPTMNNRAHRVILLPPAKAAERGELAFGMSCAIAFGAEVDSLVLDCNITRGTFDGRRLAGAAPRGDDAPIDPSKGTKVNGKLSAEVLDPARPLTDPIREDWPWWRGPLTAGVSNASALKDLAMVDDPEHAALAWVSDERTPKGRGPDTRGRLQRIVGEPLMGGWGSPIVADNRVVLSYYTPAGKDYSWGADKAIAGGGNPEHYRIHLVDADDVVHCFDARTGRTLWKRVYPLAGLNYASFNKSGPQLTAAAAGGRIFAMGSAGRVYALSAATGQTLWQTDIGRRHRIMENHRVYMKGKGWQYGARSDMNGPLLAVADVVVMSDYNHTKGGDKLFRYEIANGLIALDQATGRPRWQIADVGAVSASPWRHAGKDYLLVPGRDDMLCVEASSGKVVWKLPDAGGPFCPPLADDYLVCNVGEGKAKETSLACFKLGLDMPTKLWQLASGTGYHAYVSPVILDGHVYTGHKQLACIELTTGRIKATLASPVPGGSLSGGSGRLILWPDLGHVHPDGYMVRADPAGFKPLGAWSLEVSAPYDTTMNYPIVDGRFIVRLADRVACYDLRAASAVRDRKHFAANKGKPRTAAPPIPTVPGTAPTPTPKPSSPDMD